MVIFQATIKACLLTGPSGAYRLQSNVITSAVLTALMIHMPHEPTQMDCLTFTVPWYTVKISVWFTLHSNNKNNNNHDDANMYIVRA